MKMRLEDGAVVTDPWRVLDDEAAAPDGAPVIVSLDRWQREGDALARRNAPLGLLLAPDTPPAALAEADLDRFAVIALDFPAFTDGRGFSLARLLRRRFRYRGELRAVGQVLRDQAAFLRRCGFDTVEPAPEDLPAWRAALSEISLVYQPAEDRRVPIPALRQARGTALTTPARAASPSPD